MLCGMLRFSLRSTAHAWASISAGHQCRGGSLRTPPAVITISSVTTAVRSKTSRWPAGVEDRQQRDARYGAAGEAAGDEADRRDPPVREPPRRGGDAGGVDQPRPDPAEHRVPDHHRDIAVRVGQRRQPGRGQNTTEYDELRRRSTPDALEPRRPGSPPAPGRRRRAASSHIVCDRTPAATGLQAECGGTEGVLQRADRNHAGPRGPELPAPRMTGQFAGIFTDPVPAAVHVTDIPGDRLRHAVAS